MGRAVKGSNTMAKLTKTQQAEVDRVLKLASTKTGLKTLLKRPWKGPDILRLSAAQWEPVRVALESIPYTDRYDRWTGKYAENSWSMSRDLLHMRSTAEMIAFLIKKTIRDYERFEAKVAAGSLPRWEYPNQPGRIEFKVMQKSVSRSGMYRHLKVAVMTKDGLTEITWGVALILGWKYHDDETIGVSGCGMDMHFHTIYSLVETIKHAMLPKVNDGGNWCAFSQQNVYRISSY
jgi:hypothetical protein